MTQRRSAGKPAYGRRSHKFIIFTWPPHFLQGIPAGFDQTNAEITFKAKV